MKIIINISRLAKVIINMVVYHHSLFDLFVFDRSLLFTLKFLFSLCYFYRVKYHFFITFYLQTDSQTKCQNNTTEAYLRTLVNFKQNNWAKLLLITKFAYNNTKNVNISHILFKLNCRYYL